MTTGCCEPRQAGSQDTRVETERRSGTVTAACSAHTSAHPVYGGIRSTADGHASPVRQAGQAQQPVRVRTCTTTGSRRGLADRHEVTATPPTGRGRRPPSLDLYLVTVSYSAANPAAAPPLLAYALLCGFRGPRFPAAYVLRPATSPCLRPFRSTPPILRVLQVRLPAAPEAFAAGSSPSTAVPSFVYPSRLAASARTRSSPACPGAARACPAAAACHPFLARWRVLLARSLSLSVVRVGRRSAPRTRSVRRSQTMCRRGRAHLLT